MRTPQVAKLDTIMVVSSAHQPAKERVSLIVKASGPRNSVQPSHARRLYSLLSNRLIISCVTSAGGVFPSQKAAKAAAVAGSESSYHDISIHCYTTLHSLESCGYLRGGGGGQPR
jgi:hypothetical protein